MAAESQGMSFGTKALVGIGLLVAVAWGLPVVLDTAAANPKRLRAAARATRSARDRALAAGGRSAKRAGRYLASKL